MTAASGLKSAPPAALLGFFVLIVLRGLQCIDEADINLNSSENIFGCLHNPEYENLELFLGSDFADAVAEAGVTQKRLARSWGGIGAMGGATVPVIDMIWRNKIGGDGLFHIPWAYHPVATFSEYERSVIQNSLADLAERVGTIRFVSWIPNDTYWLSFQNSNDGCYVSSIGRWIAGANPVNVKGSCVRQGIVQHEVMHALGFYHEQSRPDRDNYVKINWDNIMDGSIYRYQFIIQTSIDTLRAPYDFSSVMHYGAYDFSKGNGLKTIDSGNHEIGQRAGASDLDIVQIRLMYQCPSRIRSFNEYMMNPCTAECKCGLGMKGCAGNGGNGACHNNLECVSDTCVAPTARHPVQTFQSSSANFDLNNAILTFTYSETLGYQVSSSCHGTTGFLFESSNAQPLHLGEDDSTEVYLGFEFSFFGRTYSSAFVGSNGYITFGSGDSTQTPTLLSHFQGPPRISALFVDLSPDSRSKISYGRMSSSMGVVTWDNIKQYANANRRQSFQVALEKDGTITIMYKGALKVFGKEVIVGVGSGGGIPRGFQGHDLVKTQCPIKTPIASSTCCSNLQSFKTLDGSSVCGGSLVPGCRDAQTFSASQETCKAIGSRLCTSDELRAGVLQNTGCEIHNKVVWTSTACSVDGYPGHLVGLGHGKGGIECRQDKATHATGCCADTCVEYSNQCCETSLLLRGFVFGRGTSSVCSASYVPKCAYGETFSQAQGICNREGARLCTYDEVKAGFASSKDCGHDSRAIWTSTLCNLNSGGTGHLVGGGGSGQGKACRPNTASHAVRCCADSCQNTPSKKCCSELVPGFSDMQGSPAVCGASPNCNHHSKVYPEAEVSCSAVGARLCTLPELQAREATDTGCGFDSRVIWSSTPCLTSSGQPGRYTATGDGKNPRCRDFRDLYAVRCCADTCQELSSRCCGELSRSFSLFEGSHNVCAASELPKCYSSNSFQTALDICRRQGARLCTPDELRRKEAKGTGCGLDQKHVWTSQACVSGGWAGHFVALGDSGAKGKCVPDSEPQGVRCCADACYYAEPAPLALPAVDDAAGVCGTSHGGISCASEGAPCCASSGSCGAGEEHCGKECQPDFSGYRACYRQGRTFEDGIEMLVDSIVEGVKDRISSVKNSTSMLGLAAKEDAQTAGDGPRREAGQAAASLALNHSLGVEQTREGSIDSLFGRDGFKTNSFISDFKAGGMARGDGLAPAKADDGTPLEAGSGLRENGAVNPPGSDTDNRTAIPLGASREGFDFRGMLRAIANGGGPAALGSQWTEDVTSAKKFLSEITGLKSAMESLSQTQKDIGSAVAIASRASGRFTDVDAQAIKESISGDKIASSVSSVASRSANAADARTRPV